jgi:4-carboxymuconolactone decarboxylase
VGRRDQVASVTPCEDGSVARPVAIWHGPPLTEGTMADQADLLARGREVTTQLWGDLMKGPPTMPAFGLAPDFFALVTQYVFGMFWSRPNLDVRSRSLCTVAQLAALGKTDELKGHLLGALNLGIKKEELIEVLMQTACYAGVPVAVAALNAAAEVLTPPAKGGKAA